MKTRFLSFLFLFLILRFHVSGQTRADLRDMFNQGEMFVLFEEYNEALRSYIDLNKLFPDNANYKFRIGQCYLYIPGEKDKAIPYLEDAVNYISPKHKSGRFKEKSAPLDALYYLANAYRINNQIDKAIETYKLFLRDMDQKLYDSAVVNFQLQTCYNAKEMMKTPVFVREKNMGGIINERYSETNPVVSIGEESLFFTRVLPFRKALFFSRKTDTGWSNPADIITELKVDDNFYPTSISADGKTLHLYSDYDYVGNIYVSHLENGRWSPVEKLGEHINTKYWESHATLSPDGKKLYFSSNRKGGHGGLDIYVSELDSIGRWGPAKNLGPVINTEYHEDTPFLTDDGKTLFFSSRGHYNMGGYDIFYSTLIDDSTWSVPLNVGYPLNTTDDDLFFMPVGSGYEGYIARYDEKGYGLQDLFKVEIFSDDHPRKFLIRGIARIQDLRPDIAEKIRVTVTDLNAPDNIVIVYTDPQTGKYEFEVKHGDYELIFDADGTVKDVRRLNLPLDHHADTVALPPARLEKIDMEAGLKVLTDSLIMTLTGDSVRIQLYTEPKSLLDVLVMNEGLVLASDRYNIIDTAFTYWLLPQPGINIIDFSLTDMFNNLAMARVVVNWEKEKPATVIPKPEYERIIAGRQVNAFLDMLNQKADEDLKKVISRIDTRKEKFGSVDDVITHLRELAVERGIEGSRVDKLALKNAVDNDILTQSVVDYLVQNTSGELNRILRDINILDLRLKSWDDLKAYIVSRSEGRISSSDLDRLAAYLIYGPGAEINILRNKIEAYAATIIRHNEIIKALANTDSRYFISAGVWLNNFHDFALAEGLTIDDLALLYAVIGFPFKTTPGEALKQLLHYSADDFIRYSGRLNLKGVRDIRQLMHVLLNDKDKEFESSGFFNALAITIAENDVPEDSLVFYKKGMSALPGLLLLFGGLLILIIIIFLFMRKKKKEDNSIRN